MSIIKSQYTTRISTDGPAGNIFVVLSTATARLKQLRHKRTEIEAFAKRVMSTKSYADALNVIREYFPVDSDND